MFDSRRRGRAAEQAARQKQAGAGDVLAADVRLIGIVRTSNPRSSIAIVEESGRQVLCRIGDTIGGMLVTDIQASEVCFETAGGRQIARIQPGRARPRAVSPGTPPTPAGPDGGQRILASSGRRRLRIGAREIRELAHKLPRAVHAERGKVAGLRLSRDVMGLREGDWLTHVGGQSLGAGRPKQKLWQIVSKYRHCQTAGREIPLIVQRDSRKLEFVLVPST